MQLITLIMVVSLFILFAIRHTRKKKWRRYGEGFRPQYIGESYKGQRAMAEASNNSVSTIILLVLSVILLIIAGCLFITVIYGCS